MRLLLCDRDGTPVGSSPELAVHTPWWQEVEDVVVAASDHGLDVTVLRLVDGVPAPGFATAGGTVTYLAELHAGAPCGRPWDARLLDDHPLRMPWARPGGPALEVGWALAALEAAGRPVTGRPVQVRTWNLSSIWRIPTGDGPCWLKSVPPFFAHEGAVVGWVAARHPGVVPVLVATGAGRSLFEHVPGEDQHGADGAASCAMLDVLCTLQASTVGATDGLIAAGATDWRLAGLAGEVATALERAAGDLTAGERAALDDLVHRFDERLRALDACGLPDTLVHGDFHPGNVRAGGGRTTLVDWGDSGVGHPLVDVADLVHRLPTGAAGVVLDHAVSRWSALVPGAAVAEALDLLRPLALARNAVVFERFLAGIEPSERCYHRDDPARSLRLAAAVLTGSAGVGVGP